MLNFLTLPVCPLAKCSSDRFSLQWVSGQLVRFVVVLAVALGRLLPRRACERGCSPSQHLVWTSDKCVAASVCLQFRRRSKHCHLAWAFYSVFQQTGLMH